MTATPTPSAAPPNTCATCRYYIAPAAGATDGTCHRNPPIAVANAGQRWPLVGPGEWCGESQ